MAVPPTAAHAPPFRPRASFRSSFPLRSAVVGTLLLIALMAVAYYFTGKLGLRLAFLNASATAVWPPSGIALAALLLAGRRIWPGVWLGALLVNITVTPSWPVSIAIASGNTLEAVLAAWLVRRFAGGASAFERPREMLWFFVLAGGVSTAVAATIGVTSLVGGGFAAWENYLPTWLNWWLGDAVSMIILAPLFLIWATIPLPAWSRKQAWEAAAVLIFIVLLASALFVTRSRALLNHEAWAFLCFPPLLWTAYRLGPHATISAAVMLCAIALGGTVRNLGSAVDSNTQIELLQAFVATITVPHLVLAATVAQRARDLRELRNAEADARASEQRKSAVLESALDCIVTMDERGRIVDFNPAAERAFGFARQNVIGEEVAETIIPPELRDAHRAGLQRFLDTGVGRVFGRRVEFTGLRADGSRFPIELAVSATSSASGTAFFTAYVRDISERKRQERGQSLRLEIHRILGAASSTDQALTQVLQATCEVLEWQTAALWTLAPDENTLRCEYFWRSPYVRVERFEEASLRMRFPKGVGLPGRVWANARPAWIPDVVHDDNFPRAAVAAQDGLHAGIGFPILIGQDVHAVMEFFGQSVLAREEDVIAMLAEVGLHLGQFLDRRRSQEALRASREQLQLVTDSMSAPVARCSRDLRYLWVSRTCAQWLGLPEERIVNRPILEIVGGETLEKMRPHIERALRGEHVIYEEQIAYSGVGPKWIQAIYSPTRDAAGRVDGWVAIIVDIDQRVRAERALLQADRRKDEFLATLAHELRNPLAPLRAAATLLSTSGITERDVSELRGVIDRQVTQMARLLDDLLDMSRITAGKINIVKQRTLLNTVIASAIECSRPLIQAQGIDLVLSLPQELLYVEVDFARLSQVFSNLLNNAAKYSNRGGHIWVSAEKLPAEIVIRVRDDGIGIPRDRLPNIFDLFVQVDSGSQRAHGGLGIGLTLVQRLVQMHGGRVEAHSAGRGAGSEFIVHLPLPPHLPQLIPAAPLSPPPAEPSAGLRILVADDNVDAARMLEKVLSIQGHQVCVAHDGVAALKLGKEFDPRVALLDIGMPGL